MATTRSTAKIADSKGRLLLGSEYANTEFILERRPDGVILLRPAVTVPVAEAWLFQNKEALASVTKGLEQARRRAFVDSPVRTEDEDWISKLDD
jgi:hypothetical protein